MTVPARVKVLAVGVRAGGSAVEQPVAEDTELGRLLVKAQVREWSLRTSERKVGRIHERAGLPHYGGGWCGPLPRSTFPCEGAARPRPRSALAAPSQLIAAR